MPQSGTASLGLGGVAAKLFAIGTDTVAAVASSVTPGTNDRSFYTFVFGTVTPVATGTYRLVMYNAGGFECGSIDEVYVSANGWSVAPSMPTNNINVLPLNAAVQSRVRGTTIEVFSGETVQVSIAVVDAAGSAVSLTGRTLRIVLESSSSTVDKTVIEDGSIARSGNTITFAISGGVNGARRLWSLRDTSGDVVLAHGVVSTSYAPKKD